MKDYKPIYSGLTYSLPDNVHILTLETLSPDTIILRMEHIYEKNEDPKLSQEVDVVITALFTDFEVSDMTELNLSANQLMSDKKVFDWKTTNDVDGENISDDSDLKVGSSWQVLLKPMQIRTFRCKIFRK